MLNCLRSVSNWNNILHSEKHIYTSAELETSSNDVSSMHFRVSIYVSAGLFCSFKKAVVIFKVQWTYRQTIPDRQEWEQSWTLIYVRGRISTKMAQKPEEKLLGNTPWYVPLISDQISENLSAFKKKSLETVDQDGLFNITCTLNFVVQKCFQEWMLKGK